jgi:ATP-dependent helicase/nuclease subunit A
VIAAGAARGLTVARGEAATIAGRVAGFAGGELCARLGRAGSARREEGFAFALGEVMLTGVVDVLAREPGGRLLVVDYKTDALAGREPAVVAQERYDLQRAIYALAALRTGAPSVEVLHVFLERAADPVAATFAAGEAAALEGRLRERAAGILARRFPVTDAPRRATCEGCPARDGLCSWPAAMTRREAADTLF